MSVAVGRALKKHGPHVPLRNDLPNARYAPLQAAGKEYAVMLLEHFAGYSVEAKREPRTNTYSRALQL